MTTSLDTIIDRHLDLLVDEIAKDAFRQIPSYGEAPIRLVLERVERWLKTLADSIRRNDPDVLRTYLAHIAEERREEKYPISELHAIMQITEKRVDDAVVRECTTPVECNANLALLDAAMDTARMVLSSTYLLIAEGKRSP